MPVLAKSPRCPDYPAFPLRKVYARLKPGLILACAQPVRHCVCVPFFTKLFVRCSLGDIVLFNIRSPMASVQRLICHCFWDHVGIVTMTRADERLHLLEATQQGVTCLPLRQRLTQYAKVGAVVAARIFSWRCKSAAAAKHRFKHIIRTLRVFSHEVLGNRYGGFWSSIRLIFKHKIFRIKPKGAPAAASANEAKPLPASHKTNTVSFPDTAAPASPAAVNSQDNSAEFGTSSASQRQRRLAEALAAAEDSVSTSSTTSEVQSDDKSESRSGSTSSSDSSRCSTPRDSVPSPSSSVSASPFRSPARTQQVHQPPTPVTGVPNLQKYFCSNLVAIALVKIGALSGTSMDEAACYLPRAFEPGNDVDQNLSSSFLLGPPLLCYATR